MPINRARVWPPGKERFRWLGWGAVVALLGTALLAPASPALSNDTTGNNGTVKIHEGAGENDPGEVRNEPHVCTFHLHFYFADPEQAGTWEIQEWSPGDKGTVVLSGTYDTQGDGEDREPDAGVYTLPDGHYKLFWDGDLDTLKHDKMKVFWVDCPTPTETPAATGTFVPTQSPGGETEVPTGTPEVTPVPTGTPEVTPVPTGTPDVTPVPTGTPEVTPVPTGTPEVTPAPTGTFVPTQSPGAETEQPTGTPEVTAPPPTGTPEVTPAPTASFEQSQGAETSAPTPSFEQSQGAETSAPGPTQPNTSTGLDAGPDSTGWRGLMIALAFLIALLLVADPSRPLGRGRRRR